MTACRFGGMGAPVLAGDVYIPTMRRSGWFRHLFPPGSIKALALFGLFLAPVLAVVFYLNPESSVPVKIGFIILCFMLGPLSIMSFYHPEWEIPWWIVVSGGSHLSPEEHWAWGAIWLMSMPFMILIFLVAAYVLIKLEFDPHLGPLMVFVFDLPASVYLGRRTCEWLWPEKIKKADANAGKRRELLRREHDANVGKRRGLLEREAQKTSPDKPRLSRP
jgi:hypothetical protein